MAHLSVVCDFQDETISFEAILNCVSTGKGILSIQFLRFLQKTLKVMEPHPGRGVDSAIVNKIVNVFICPLRLFASWPCVKDSNPFTPLS